MRKMTSLLVIWCALIGIWIAVGINSNEDAVRGCMRRGVLTYRECQGATAVGTGIGVALVVVVGVVGFLVLSVVWFMTRPARRDCPVCGRDVPRGLTRCEFCGHDFARAVRIAS